MRIKKRRSTMREVKFRGRVIVKIKARDFA